MTLYEEEFGFNDRTSTGLLLHNLALHDKGVYRFAGKGELYVEVSQFMSSTRSILGVGPR